jgi:hypothetical protein
MKYETDEYCPLTEINKTSLRNLISSQLEQFEELVHEKLKKSNIRDLHSNHLTGFHKSNFKFWESNKTLVKKIVIDGNKLDPKKIKPILLEVTTEYPERVRAFRLAKFNWSVPPSNGFGRRMRFLVWDKHHDSLIGVIGLTDPVFNLKVRDEYINWSADDRKQRLVSVLDAFMLGAVPPYSHILGGKLVASLLNSTQISDVFQEKYKNTTGVISQISKKPKLAAITTTSVLGRSSVYNRLKLDGNLILHHIGYTSGFGHFQFTQNIFDELKTLVIAHDIDKKAGFDFGNGPNWKIRVIREGLKILGLKQAHVKHGIKRGVYYCPHFENSENFLNGKDSKLKNKITRTTSALSQLAMERWMLPRSQRDQSYKEFRVDNWLKSVEAKIRSSNAVR